MTRASRLCDMNHPVAATITILHICIISSATNIPLPIVVSHLTVDICSS